MKRLGWKTIGRVGVLLLAISHHHPGGAATYEPLAGIWQCHFLEAKNSFEKEYYSNWEFDAAQKNVVAYWSPVHKGEQFRYEWDGRRLVLHEPWGPPSPRYGTFDAQLHHGTDLVIRMPDLRWKGWNCERKSALEWPRDGLQFLDYNRYPWLANLTEDGLSISRYRDPKQYEDWVRHHPR